MWGVSFALTECCSFPFTSMENGLIPSHGKAKGCAWQSSTIRVFQTTGIIVLSGVFLVFSYKKEHYPVWNNSIPKNRIGPIFGIDLS